MRGVAVQENTSPLPNYFIPGFLYRVFLLVLAGIMLYLIIDLKSKTAAHYWADPILLIYTIFVTTFELSRLVGAMFYKRSVKSIYKSIPAALAAESYEPTVSFVIPCKNEEKTIAETIHKCFQANYPPEKIEVIVINDGSTDGTLRVLRKMQKLYPALIVINWRKNRGKRYGMGAGFRRASGEIVVQLDSDSFIDPPSFRNLIKPFQNPSVGAVCAHADPLNAEKNFLTRMQAGYYFLAFRIMKAAESTFLSVFCCSGCSSAYRKSVVTPILKDFLKETFLGLPITWGDDRALTNWVLRLNYKAIYVDDVQAYTICPSTWKMFLKQQVRWKKGWFVNSLFASKFIWKKDFFVAATYFYPLILVTLLTPFMAARALIYNPLVHGIAPTYYFLGVLFVASLIVIYYRYVNRQNKYWPYVFFWSLINMFFLSFLLFYALIRLQDRKWGTR